MQKQELSFQIHEEVRDIMGEVWTNRAFKDRLLSAQVREMANWKPRWWHDDIPLSQTEIDRLHELASLAEKHGI